MDAPVHFHTDENVGIITIDSPPVNALNAAVRQGVVDCLAQAERDAVSAVVLIGAGRTFSGGADITEFVKPPMEPTLHELIRRTEECSKPVIAAVHGTAMGGAIELALGCHYRCAVGSARLGLPEVKLGLIPGAGGTQRLPRIVGVEQALRIITSGAPVGAKKALEIGLIDELMEGDLLAGAVAFAKKVVALGRPLRKTSELNEKVTGVDGAIFDDFRAQLSKRKRGFEAPQRCVDAIEVATKLPFEEGLAKELDIFMACLASPQSAGQRHIFFAERQAAKIPDVPKDTPVLQVRQAAVLGAGTMGGGIAMVCADVGMPVYLLEQSQELLDKGLAKMERGYASAVSKGRLAQEDMDARMDLIKPTLSFDDLRDVDLVIEAVFEEMDLKKEVFRKLDEVCKPEAILATNTSTLDVDEIAAVTSRPEYVIGMHFFSPANVMPLLEVVRGEKTSKEVLATVMALAKTIKKVAVVVGVCDGFVANRMFLPCLREASFLLEEGALPKQVDRVLSDFGFALGPFAIIDLAGLDIGWRIRKRQGIQPGMRYSAIADKICEMGRFGQKTGRGYYTYEQGPRTPIPDPVIEQLIEKESELLGIERRTITDEEILERCIYGLVNEGAALLDEGIAQRASDIDVIYIYGFAFPAYRGGPMCYADTVGLAKVYETVCALHEAHGQSWRPAPLLEKLAREGGRFSDV